MLVPIKLHSIQFLSYRSTSAFFFICSVFLYIQDSSLLHPWTLVHPFQNFSNRYSSFIPHINQFYLKPLTTQILPKIVKFPPTSFIVIRDTLPFQKALAFLTQFLLIFRLSTSHLLFDPLYLSVKSQKYVHINQWFNQWWNIRKFFRKTCAIIYYRFHFERQVTKICQN